MSETAVIFDVDGVLVDSYRPHLESWRALAHETGVSFGEKEFAASFGQTSRDILKTYWPECDPQQRSALDDRKEALYREIIARDFPAMEGAGALIDALRAAGVRLAVGSSGPPENVALALEGLGRRTAFGAVVTGRDVTRGKPDPQVFELAADRLGVRPSRCVVIEDAPAGIDAAHRAGMAAVALLSTGRRAGDFETCRPALVVRSLAELSPASLQKLSNQSGRGATT